MKVVLLALELSKIYHINIVVYGTHSEYLRSVAAMCGTHSYPLVDSFALIYEKCSLGSEYYRS